MLARRIVARVPDQAAIAVGAPLAFLHDCFVPGPFAWVGIAEQPERADIRQGVVAQGQLERGGVLLLCGGDLAQAQQLVQPQRRTGNSLVTQDLSE